MQKLSANLRFEVAAAAFSIALLSGMPSSPILAKMGNVERSSCVAQPQVPQELPTYIFAPIPPIKGLRSLANPLNSGVSDPLTIITIGDSAIWGNGLDDDRKYSHQVARELADATQRTVNLVTFAHSGADLSSEGGQCFAPIQPSDNGIPPGDLNGGLPTITEQASYAAVRYANADVVLLDGCINDVSALQIALPFPFSGVSEDEIRKRTYEHCSNNMLNLLKSVQGNFPKATIVLSNYWLIISDKSSPAGVTVSNGTIRATSNNGNRNREFENLLATQRKAEQETAQNRVESDLTSNPAMVFRRWSANSKAFLAVSERCFDWAVSIVDGAGAKQNASSSADEYQCPKTDRIGPRPVTKDVRVFLATVSSEPQYSYGAGKFKRLWSVPVGPFRHDLRYNRRGVLCRTHYPAGGERFICTVNPTAHPNVSGAKAFTDSIMSILRVAWKPQ